MSTTMLYTEGKNKLYWGKFFAKSAVFNDSDVEEALKSGEWFKHPEDAAAEEGRSPSSDASATRTPRKHRPNAYPLSSLVAVCWRV